jgi:hypothetical protein
MAARGVTAATSSSKFAAPPLSCHSQTVLKHSNGPCEARSLVTRAG